ncbi:hypothetical protein A2U01_0074670 [Trifolium medium]|uniref:Uncharacterized protein n=1 Tax=Trifolium medium TaxID=97028 RepID=A0A392SYZ3_9FABA|nr:hypothetical protein [Trifolium medium]
MHLARRAVHAVRVVSPSGVCAMRSWCWRDAQRSPVFSDFLLVLARRARVVCAARRVFGQS